MSRSCVTCDAGIPAVDARPRYTYALPDGRLIAVIFDHDETPPSTIRYEVDPVEGRRAFEMAVLVRR